MAMTKVEASKLTQDMLLRGVIETIVKESSILAMLPFMDIIGSGMTYNRELTMPSSSFYDPGDTWTEATPTFDPVTVGLKIIGGDADVDNFLQKTYSNVNDLEAVVIASRAKSTAHAFSTAFYTGDSSSNAKAFDGLGKLAVSGQTIGAGTDGGYLTLDLLDELIDLVKPGRPDALLMHKRTRRTLNQLRRASGVMLETTVNQFGQHVTYYDGIPVLVDDFIPISESLGTGNNLSSLYAVKFGMSGLMGLENGGITVDTVGELETKDATRHRIKWYCGLACYSDLGLARLKGLFAGVDPGSSGESED